MTGFHSPLIESYKPATYEDRGVAPPFTAPRLAGARVRRAERAGLEFIVPNPSGGRGVYVLHWGGVRQICGPTVHDTLLHQRLTRLTNLDPRTVRLAARHLAAEGHAGRDAALAARAAIAGDKKAQTLLHFLLLLMFMEQIEPAGLLISPETEHTPDLDRRARTLMSRFAASAGRGVNEISGALEDLGHQFVSVGLPRDPTGARVPQLIARLDSTAAGLESWARTRRTDDRAGLAAALGRGARRAATSAGIAARTAMTALTDLPGLLSHWGRDANMTARLTSQPEWILDGWEPFCLLWESESHPHGQRSLLPELAAMAPAAPREATGGEPDPDHAAHPSPTAAADDTWREGAAAFTLIARNERLHARLS